MRLKIQIFYTSVVQWKATIPKQRAIGGRKIARGKEHNEIIFSYLHSPHDQLSGHVYLRYFKSARCSWIDGILGSGVSRVIVQG